MSTKNNDLVFGDVELDDVEFEPRHVKVRVTTMVDEDVLNALKKIASSKGQKYQTVLNQVLRAFVERKKDRKLAPVGEKRIREIVREEIKKRA
jgi:hypothetical protein